MRIFYLFLILVCLLMALGGVIFMAFLQGFTQWYLGLIAGGIGLILCYLIYFYHKVLRPLHSIDFGMDLLREQDFSTRLSRVGQYEADRIVEVFNRMMQQLKNERLRLREQNHFLDLLIKASPMGVIILNFGDEITQINPVAARLLQVKSSQAVGKCLSDFDSVLAAELCAIQLEETREVRLSDANIYKCTYGYFIDQGLRHPFYLIERMTDEVMQAEKMAYGKVIRMIAHEVNNTTAGITSTLDTVEQALAEESGKDDIREVMRVCIERCYSMSGFITRFADVVKIPEPTLLPGSLNELAASCVQFMESTCASRHISLRLLTDENERTFPFDVSLMEQVLVNIIKNSMESIGQEGEIVITVSAPHRLEVADNGPGIDKETAAKLFSPFFTTKPNGQGIGLVFIREVLTRHGCTFSLRTDSDGWTRFCISF